MKNNQKKSGKQGAILPEELQKENELLKLKLRAETGAEFGTAPGLHPDIENQFLKNVIEFEKQFAEGRRMPVYEIIGKPDFKKAETLTDEQITSALSGITEIMLNKGVGIDFLAEYPDREKYRFITEELFNHETDFISVPGMMTQFIYEEFHPNHDYDITRQTEEFIRRWFEMEFSEYSSELADQWITDSGAVYRKQEILEKFNSVFENYKRFENAKYKILKVQADLSKDGETGLGFAEGFVRYDAITDGGEKFDFEGPFKLYFQMKYEWWNIFFAVWPGLKW